MTESYQTYEPPAGDPEPAAGADEVWMVLIEYANRGDAKPPTLLEPLRTKFATRNDALAEAARQAFAHRPPDPMSPRRRRVFEITDGYVALIDGAMSAFHISVRAVRFVGEADQ